MGIFSKIWINGEVIDSNKANVSIASHTLHYGLGVFDGIMAYWKKNSNSHAPFKIKEHYKRFLDSAELLGLKNKFSITDLEKATFSLLDLVSNQPNDFYVRPIIFRALPHIPLTGSTSLGDGDIAIMLMEVPKSEVTEVSLMISSYERVKGVSIPVQSKVCAAYTNSYLARLEAEKNGFNDGILLNTDGFVCEASAANIFFIKNNILVTPLITRDIFPGITRSTIIDIAEENGIEVQQIPIHSTQIQQYDACFLTATLMGIVAVNKISEVVFHSNDNECFKSIRKKYFAETEKHHKQI
jgi:branched-chain amino acid aminotransferase